MQTEPVPYAPAGSGRADSLQALIDSSAVFASCRLSTSGRILSANQALLDLLQRGGPDGLIGKPFQDACLVRSEDWVYWQRAASGDTVTGIEFDVRTRDGRILSLRGDIAAIGDRSGRERQLLTVLADVSETKQIRAVMQHAARSEALGSLTSGMIHDFKNILTVLVGNLYLVAEGVRNQPELFEQAKRARDVARRGADLTRDLLAFSRHGETEPRALNLARIVENLAPLLEHAVGARISLDCAIAPSVSAIEVNPAQLESAIVNLVINARDAIPENGRICIAAANAAVADAQARSLGLASGSYVRLSVQDDGAGMPAAVRARVFEPFFSTKGADRGTGLGLSMVRWFAENHGGAVLVESEEGSGTTITIFLPSAAAPDEDSALLTMPLKSLPGGDENVLLIARDPHLGETTRDSLAVLGYRVTLSGDVRAIGPQLRTGKFALLMLDVATVGDSRVVALGRALRQRFPLVKLIVIAGSSSGAAVGGPSGAGVLGMPFTLKDVALLVRATLEGENHGR